MLATCAPLSAAQVNAFAILLKLAEPSVAEMRSGMISAWTWPKKAEFAT